MGGEAIVTCNQPNCTNPALSPAAECIVCIKAQAKRLGRPGPV